jgi:hypothetical protein
MIYLRSPCFINNVFQIYPQTADTWRQIVSISRLQRRLVIRYQSRLRKTVTELLAVWAVAQPCWRTIHSPHHFNFQNNNNTTICPLNLVEPTVPEKNLGSFIVVALFVEGHKRKSPVCTRLENLNSCQGGTMHQYAVGLCLEIIIFQWNKCATLTL